MLECSVLQAIMLACAHNDCWAVQHLMPSTQLSCFDGWTLFMINPTAVSRCHKNQTNQLLLLLSCCSRFPKGYELCLCFCLEAKAREAKGKNQLDHTPQTRQSRF